MPSSQYLSSLPPLAKLFKMLKETRSSRLLLLRIGGWDLSMPCTG
jgi:hypothetical protein